MSNKRVPQKVQLLQKNEKIEIIYSPNAANLGNFIF